MTIRSLSDAREQARALFVEVFGFQCPWCGERFGTPQGVRQHRMKVRRCRIYRRSKVRRVVTP